MHPGPGAGLQAQPWVATAEEDAEEGGNSRSSRSNKAAVTLVKKQNQTIVSREVHP